MKKDLFIIHNLSTYTFIKQVENYLNNYLLNSVTFNLEEGHKISTIEKGKINGKYYYERKDEQKIFHLIFANEDSEAGNYYNEFTLKFIENTYQNIINPESFDIIESIKERFIELSKDIIENNGENKKIELKDFEDTVKMKDKKIKLNNPSTMELKKCLIDELGFSNLRNNGFEPLYNYFKVDDTLFIRVEGAGNYTMKYELDSVGEYTLIKLYGEKKKDKEPEKLEDNLFNNREFGKFNLDILLNGKEYKLKNEAPKYSDRKGLYMLEFKLDKNIKGDLFELKEEDEI